MTEFEIKGAVPTWPDDTDGDMLRVLYDEQFDFSKEHEVGFIIDSDTWPPTADLLAYVCNHFSDIEEVPPEEAEDESGYLIVFLTGKVDYDFVTSKQKELSDSLSAYSAWCDSWTVDLG